MPDRKSMHEPAALTFLQGFWILSVCRCVDVCIYGCCIYTEWAKPKGKSHVDLDTRKRDLRAGFAGRQ